MAMLSILFANNSSLLCSRELLLHFYVSSGKRKLTRLLSLGKFFNPETLKAFLFLFAKYYLLSWTVSLLDFYASSDNRKGHHLEVNSLVIERLCFYISFCRQYIFAF
jgi:hypothetical protein